MIEKLKTAVLIVLVALSLLQSYLLAYSMPGLVATVRSDQDYVQTEPLGPTASLESVIFPERLVVHLGGDQHTIIYPGTQFYDMILGQRLAGREFKSIQLNTSNMNWDAIRRESIGIELVFDNGIAVELLQKLLKLEGDSIFFQDKIDRILIYKLGEREEVRTFFFSSDGYFAYEAVRADLTVHDVQDYVGFGQYLTKYELLQDGIYVPLIPMPATEMVYPYAVYSPEQIQRSLFFDPSTTRAIQDRNGSQIYTDGKRGLLVEQNGLWISYTNSPASQEGTVLPSENVYASVDFVNKHGGWDGIHRLVNQKSRLEDKYVVFQQYLEQYPIVDDASFRYGYIRLTLQHGTVTVYDRSLITLGPATESRTPRWLQGGDILRKELDAYERRNEVTALFPALKPVPISNNLLKFEPIWAVRLSDGTEEMLVKAYPVGYEPDIPDIIDSSDADEQVKDGEEEESSIGALEAESQALEQQDVEVGQGDSETMGKQDVEVVQGDSQAMGKQDVEVVQGDSEAVEQQDTEAGQGDSEAVDMLNEDVDGVEDASLD